MKQAREKAEGKKEIPTRDLIFITAVDLFSQKGFRGVSVRDITREVGINESSMYNHFKNKEALLTAIFESFKAEIESAVFSEKDVDLIIDRVGPLAFLEQSLDLFIQRLGSPVMNKISRILTIEQFAHENIRQLFEKQLFELPRSIYTKAFAKMIKDGAIQSFEPEMLADEYLAYSVSLYYEFAVVKHDFIEVERIKELVSRHIEFFWSRIKK
ncbi:MAG TPA: TetR/AcrR family transcriptional regulator [Clostridia bacterium]|nr:TetR/AcrR family transcriptional regulator [Clostridia bacterium]